MTAMSWGDLRRHTREILRHVEAGEDVTITVDRRPVAILRQIGDRPRWCPRDEFVRTVLANQADPALYRDLAPGTTDDLSLS